MLTPSELLNGFSHNYFPGTRLENPSNIDIHIHTYMNSSPSSNQNPHNAQENPLSHSK